MVLASYHIHHYHTHITLSSIKMNTKIFPFDYEDKLSFYDITTNVHCVEMDGLSFISHPPSIIKLVSLGGDINK